MSNPFEQDYTSDPFAELASAGQQATAAQLRPTRQPPPRPGDSNLLAQPSRAVAGARDPFDSLIPAPASVYTTFETFPGASPIKQEQQPAQQQDDDVFGLFTQPTQTPTHVDGSKPHSNVAKPAHAFDAFDLPPPPAYNDAVALPPSYDAASSCPGAAPPLECVATPGITSYEAMMAADSMSQLHLQQPQQQQQQQQQQHASTLISASDTVQQQQTLKPARPPPTAPSTTSGCSTVGPLTAARPSRPPPAAPTVGGLVPARAAPSAPPKHSNTSANSNSASSHTSSSSSRPAPAASAHQAVPPPCFPMASTSAKAPGTSFSAGAATHKCAAATTGNVGVAPKTANFGGQQVHQQEINAHIRLPPLNAKATAPLRHLAAGLGSLFAGPVDSTTMLLQYNLTSSGNTLPLGATAHRPEDHDSAAAGALTLGLSGPSYSKGQVSCVVFGAAAGRLWAGGADGRVHCWAVSGDGSVARLLHSWEAHSGKVKGLAVTPSGRLFTGSSNGSLKMWSYGSPAFADSSPPRLLRQLKKVDSRSGVGSNPHGKVVALAASAGGRVLWSVGKDSVSLWSSHNGEHLGCLCESEVAQKLSNPFASASAPSLQAVQSPAAFGLGGDIDPKQGLAAAVLDCLFERPSAELLAEEDAFDSEKDAASLAYNAAVKGAAKAGKLFNKLTKMAAAKILEEGKLGGREDLADAGLSAHSASSQSLAGKGLAGSDPHGSLERKVERWGTLKKLAAAADGSMWLSFKHGLLEKYSEAGQLLWSSAGLQQQEEEMGRHAGGQSGPSVQGFKPDGDLTALAAVGSSIWVGDQQGRIWVMDSRTAALLRSWKAHSFPVRSIAAAGHLVCSLSKAGSIRAWAAVRAPSELTVAWRAETEECLQQQHLQVLAVTWNVNENRPSRHALQLLLGDQVRDAQLVLLGLQEVEMGTGSVALDVVYQQIAKAKLEAGTQAAQAWVSAIGEVLASRGSWKKVALRQMSGILAVVFVRSVLEPSIGEVSTASVACGVMGYGGNKGAAAISFSLFRRRVVLVSSHFAAHQDKVEARNADYAKIVRHLHFHNIPSDKPQQQSHADSSEAAAAVLLGGPSDHPSSWSPHKQQSQQLRQHSAAAAAAGPRAGSIAQEDWGPGMKDAECLVWVGDFNYRVDTPEDFTPDRSNPENPVNQQLYHHVLRKIAARQHTDLLTGDQCSREMARGTIFHGLAEGPIGFLPTYKFEKGRESSVMQPFYDQGEKMRVPAWTDRVLFRAAAPQRSALEPNPADSPADVRVSLASPDAYQSVLHVNDSDHKPVYAQLSLQVPWYQQQQLRNTGLAMLWQVAASSSSGSSGSSHGGLSFGGPGAHVGGCGEGAVVLQVDPQQLALPGSCVPCHLTVRNPLKQSPVLFSMSSGGSGLPTWLQVLPAAGVLRPGEGLRLRVQGSKAGGWGKAGVGGGYCCQLRVVGCEEGSVSSASWPLGLEGGAAAVTVNLY